MLMIVAHHYVTNSGLMEPDSPLITSHKEINSMYMTLFSGWGKICINCFLMITGYFMCTSKITLRKFVKLIGQIYFYRVLLFITLFLGGYEILTLPRLVELIMPVWGLNYNFVSCFIVFWLLIPFLNILLNNITKHQHSLLLVLLLGGYSVMGSIPRFPLTFNYVSWFVVIYLIASYIRLRPNPVFDNLKLWRMVTLIVLTISALSILIMQWNFGNRGLLSSYFFVCDSNKLLAVLLAVSSFLWFKNMNLRYSKVINAFGSGTFGVLLIHAQSDAMNKWLWNDTVDVYGHYSLPLGYLVFYSFAVVLIIFIITNLMDQIRIATVEKSFMRFYDNSLEAKAMGLFKRIQVR